MQGNVGQVVNLSDGGSQQGGSGDFTQMGMQLSNYTGATANAFATVFSYTNSSGIVGNFTVKNTGGTNGLSYQYSYTDLFGNVTTVGPVVVTAGQIGCGCYVTLAGNCPLQTFTLQVKDTNPGSHTTYSVYDSHVQ